jgi:DNA (cytosine-5)-methyltransferase 1
LGYRTAWGIFSAAEVGAPHQRKRVFILAHSRSKRSQGPRNELGVVSSQRQGGAYFKEDCIPCNDKWPARPLQNQFDWEVSRTIESEMGRATNGSSNRLDELRLLGNGVVPATAHVAFTTLFSRLNA